MIPPIELWIELWIELRGSSISFNFGFCTVEGS